MINGFKHKKLKKLYTSGSKQGLNPEHVEDIEDILSMLDQSESPTDLNLPGMDFHELKGDRKGTFSVHVNGAWCITFKHQDGNAYDVDYEQYHDGKVKR